MTRTLKTIQISASQVRSAADTHLLSVPAGVYQAQPGTQRLFKNLSTGQLYPRDRMDIARYGMRQKERTALTAEATKLAGHEVQSLGQQHGNYVYRFENKEQLRDYVKKLAESNADQYVFVEAEGEVYESSPVEVGEEEEEEEEEPETKKIPTMTGQRNIAHAFVASKIDKQELSERMFTRIDNYKLYVKR